MWDHMGWGWGGGWGWFGLMHLLWWLVIIGAAAVLFRWAIRDRPPRDQGPAEDRALAILRERYARGEIDKPEFDERMKHLKG